MTMQQKLARLVKNQSELGRKTGIAQSAINEMISGKRKPYAWQAAAIARALGVSCDYLLFDEIEEVPRPELAEDERELVKLIREMGIVEARRRLLQLSNRPEGSLVHQPPTHTVARPASADEFEVGKRARKSADKKTVS
jgi:DNA-binding transcriptional regulator YdaS (Cro superfamily)